MVGEISITKQEFKRIKKLCKLAINQKNHSNKLIRVCHQLELNRYSKKSEDRCTKAVRSVDEAYNFKPF